jgi:hypothetical protein
MAISLLNATARIHVKDSDLDKVDNGDETTTYTLRQITPAINRELHNKHTTKTPNKKTHQMEESTDSVALLDDMVDYAVVEWTGILDDGQPAPCTTENKRMLDTPRKIALLKVAGLNQIAAEVRAESFRATA